MFTQYGDYLYLYILLISIIPAVILGLRGKKIKYYGFVLTIPMILMIVFKSKIESILFISFIIYEMILTYAYLNIRKKNGNKFYYYLFLFLSILPIIASKTSGKLFNHVFGFVGISYLCFRAIQMIIEIYDESIKEVEIFTYLYFLLFFPTISSGPIDRYRRFKENIETDITAEDYKENYLGEGIYKILLGFGYKFVFAYLIDTYVLLNIGETNSILNIIKYMYGYSLFLFFDFAGYSRMAVGTSYLLGIKVQDNFDKPWKSKDMKEFWTRWHISLSRWFGDYVYSRLTLNFMRNKVFKDRFRASHVAQLITMFIMGLWHGLESYYIIYGIYQGVVLVLTDIIQRKWKFYKKHKKEKWFIYFQIFINIQVACFGLLIFSGYLFKK